MPMELSADLAAARAEANEFLFETGEVHRLSRTRNEGGGVVERYGLVPGMDNVPANLKRREAREVVIADKVQLLETAGLEVPFGTDIRETDRVVVGGKVWEVVTDRTDPLGAYSVFDLERSE